MTTTVGPPITSYITGGRTLHYPEGGSTCWVAACPLTIVEVHPPVLPPPVQVAPLPRIRTVSAAGRHRQSIARSRENKIDVWVGCAIGCITLNLVINLATVLSCLNSMSTG